MDEFLKMDIFFAVSTAAVVLLALALAFVLWRLERVLRHIEHIAAQVAAESDTVREDLAHLRSDIRAGRGRIASLAGFLGTLFQRGAKKP